MRDQTTQCSQQLAPWSPSQRYNPVPVQSYRADILIDGCPLATHPMMPFSRGRGNLTHLLPPNHQTTSPEPPDTEIRPLGLLLLPSLIRQTVRWPAVIRLVFPLLHPPSIIRRTAEERKGGKSEAISPGVSPSFRVACARVYCWRQHSYRTPLGPAKPLSAPGARCPSVASLEGNLQWIRALEAHCPRSRSSEHKPTWMTHNLPQHIHSLPLNVKSSHKHIFHMT